MSEYYDEEDIRIDGNRWDGPFTQQVDSHTCWICDEEHFLSNGMWLSFFGKVYNNKDEEKANKRFHNELCEEGE